MENSSLKRNRQIFLIIRFTRWSHIKDRHLSREVSLQVTRKLKYLIYTQTIGYQQWTIHLVLATSEFKITALFHFWIESLRISKYASVSTIDAVFIIGGWSGNDYLSNLAQYKNNIWNNFGNLYQARGSHRAIFFSSSILVFGGSSSHGQPSVYHWH